MQAAGLAAGPPSGFTLTLDGDPAAVERILHAVYDEMARMQSPASYLLTASGPRPYSIPLPVRGQVQMRWPV